MTPREAILEVVDRDDDVALALARVIRQAEGWSISDTEARHRIRQCLRGAAGRHFEIDWALLVVDVFVRFDIREPITALLDERRRDREHELRQEARGMRTVRPSAERRRVRA